MTQLIDFVVDGSILFNISVGLGNIGLRLVVIVIGNEIFHRVIREEGLQLAGQLRRERFVVGDDQSRLTHLVDNLGNSVGFARTGSAQQHLRTQALLHACCQFLYSLGLVPGRLKGSLDLKIHVSPALLINY